MDRLLLDTEYLYTKAFNRTTNRYGKEFTWEHKAHLMGFKSKDVAGYIIEELNLPLTPEEFKQEITEIYRELFPTPIPCQALYGS
ncbi:Pseudouridine-5'-phosphatase [Formica fusca]